MMRFIACGDSLFSSRNLRNRLDPQLVELLLSADGVFTNAEFCTPNPETPPAAGRGYMTSVRPSLLDEFASLNIRMLSFVNNHTGDYGWQGVLDTMKAAEDRNLIPCGLGRSLREARLPKFLDTPAAFACRHCPGWFSGKYGRGDPVAFLAEFRAVLWTG